MSRRLDALFAERVLGVEMSLLPEVCVDAAGRRTYPTLPSYTTDLSAAWEGVERLRATQKWCCISLYSDHGYTYEASFTPAQADFATPYEHRATAFGIGGQSPALAVVLACLRAVGCDETYIDDALKGAAEPGG